MLDAGKIFFRVKRSIDTYPGVVTGGWKTRVAVETAWATAPATAMGEGIVWAQNPSEPQDTTLYRRPKGAIGFTPPLQSAKSFPERRIPPVTARISIKKPVQPAMATEKV